MSNPGDITSDLSRRAALKKGVLVAGGLLTGVSGTSGTAAAEPTEISGSTAIEEPGEYILANDIHCDEVDHGDDTVEGGCITIRSFGAGVTLNGNGHSITGNGTGTGIAVTGSNCVLQDLQIRGFERGIGDIDAGGMSITLKNSVVSDNANMGIGSTDYLVLNMEDSTVKDNGGPGIKSALPSQAEITRSTLSGNDGRAIDYHDGISVTMENSTVTGNSRGITATDGEFVNNTISNNGEYGIRVAFLPISGEGDPVSLVGNEIKGNAGAGIYFRDIGGIISENAISNNQNGVVISEERYSDPENYELTRNNIEGNAEFGVQNNAGPTAVASCNYWGHESGPGHEENPRSNPKGDKVSDNVEFVPWSIVPIEDGEGNCVGGVAPPPVGNFENPPTDPDGDGKFEDINGDGEFDTVDVRALFANRNDPTIQDNPEKFDFNDDAGVNVVDVQVLFSDLT